MALCDDSGALYVNVNSYGTGSKDASPLDSCVPLDEGSGTSPPLYEIGEALAEAVAALSSCWLYSLMYSASAGW